MDLLRTRAVEILETGHLSATHFPAEALTQIFPNLPILYLDQRDILRGGHTNTASRSSPIKLAQELRPTDRKCFRVLLCLGLFPFWLHPAAAQSQDARQIVEEAQKRARASSQKYEGLLRVIDPRGKTTEKRWQSQRSGSFGASKRVLRFTAPAEVKGVAILIINHTDRSADEWMWTPAIGRERRVAMQDRSTRFFGTDFTFEDLEEWDVDQYDHKLLGEEDLDGLKCWRIEGIPRKTKTSQYTSIQIWIRQNDYATAQVACYVKDQIVRRLKYSQIEKVQDIWTARVLEMNDLRRKSRTVLTLDKLQYNVPLNDEDFTVTGLQRDR